MSNYTKIYDGAALDTAEATIAGADFDVEFDAIEIAIATKAESEVTPTVNDVGILDVNGNVISSGIQYSTVLVDSDIDIDGTLAADSDLVVPSQKAVKTYVDSREFSGRLVTLTNVDQIVNTSVPLASWSTLDLSVAAPTIAALSPTALLLNILVDASVTISGSYQIKMRVREKGSTDSQGNSHISSGHVSSFAAVDSKAQLIVGLDTNGDFEYSFVLTGTSGEDAFIWIAGYYT